MADAGAKPPPALSPYPPASASSSSSASPFPPDFPLPFHPGSPGQLRALHDLHHPSGANDASDYLLAAPPSDATGLSGPVMIHPGSEPALGAAPAAPPGQDNPALPDVNAASQTGSAQCGGAQAPADQAACPAAAPGTEKASEAKDDGNAQNKEPEMEKPPPWSELKTKAGKERKRLPLACIACRRKKIRCSGEKPACKHCFRSRIPCVYKVTTRKAAPRTDYMAMLDKRLKRMEERVIKAIPKDEPRDMAAIGRACVRPAVPGQAPKVPKSAAQKKRSADEAFAAELEEWTRIGRNPPPGVFSANREGKAEEKSSLLTEGAEFLPPMEIQEHLAEVFFDCVYGQSYLLLHKPSFMRRLKAGTVPPVLILAVCAVSARFSTHPQLNSEPAFLRGENWATPAAQIALRRHDEPNITILTVFLLLGLHEFGTCHGGRSWSFGGQALRMAYALQLHRELDYDPLGQNGKGSQLSFTDREIRRRTMWACVLMDRYNSSGSQRPPIGNEKFLQIQLPIKESHFQMEIPGPTEDLEGNVPNPVPEGMGQLSNPKDNMGVSAYIIRAIMLWGRIVDYLNLGGKRKDPHPLWSPESGYSRLKRQIEEFSASLPPSLTFTHENLQNHAAEKIANQFLFLHIIIHQNMLFLNQFAIPLSPGGRPPKDMPRSFLSDAGRAAVEAAHHISMLIDRASGYLLTVPFAGYCAYTASTVHIWGIFSKNAQLEARSKENLRHTYRYLNKMKRYWGMFHYMVESAKERYRQFADAAIKGPHASQNGQPAPMFQYGDWFDKYPHGVSKTHWEDPDTNVKKATGDDAVMGQQPDLQSVEEFFASLSPAQRPEVPRKQQRRNAKDVQSQSRMMPQNNTAIFEQFPQEQQPPPPPPPQQQQMMDMSMANAHGVMGAATTRDFSHLNDPSSMYPQNRPQSYEPSPFDFGWTTDHLPQLDRQFVYGAYAGVDPNSTLNANLSMPANGAQGHPQNGTSLWPDQFDFSHPAGTGEFFQPSAWFLPFNLDPVGSGFGLDPNTQPNQTPQQQTPGGTGNTGAGTFGGGGSGGNMMNPFNLGMTGMGTSG